MRDASCACSFQAAYGKCDQEGAERARDVLEAAGIPTYLGAYSDAEEIIGYRLPSELRIMIPSHFAVKAEAVLDRGIYNLSVEETWKTHMASLTDGELRELDFEGLIGGLTDRIERLRGTYRNEISARENRE